MRTLWRDRFIISVWLVNVPVIKIYESVQNHPSSQLLEFQTKRGGGGGEGGESDIFNQYG